MAVPVRTVLAAESWMQMSPPLPLLSPLAVPAGLQMRTLEVQAVLLVTWSLGWRRVCLVPGWTCAGRRAPLRLALRACMSLCRRPWR